MYADAERNYAEVAEELEEVISDALAALCGRGAAVLVANAAPHPRDGVPALGIAVGSTTPQAAVEEHPDGTFTLANEHLSAVVDATGELVSLVDAATGREAIAPGAPGNRLELFRDVPNQWDAWDIDEFYRRAAVPVAEPGTAALDEVDSEPVVTVHKVVGTSPVTQWISLPAGSPALVIRTEVDWQERQKLLKLGFGLDVRADTSAAETRFGHYRRPTHLLTSWEAAQFEFCAHRWLLVDEARLRGRDRQRRHLRPRGIHPGRAGGRRHDDDLAGSHCCARPSTPTRRPTAGCTSSRSPSEPARAPPKRSNWATGRTCPGGSSAVSTRSSHWSRWTPRGSSSRR